MPKAEMNTHLSIEIVRVQYASTLNLGITALCSLHKNTALANNPRLSIGSARLTRVLPKQINNLQQGGTKLIKAHKFSLLTMFLRTQKFITSRYMMHPA